MITSLSEIVAAEEEIEYPHDGPLTPFVLIGRATDLAAKGEHSADAVANALHTCLQRLSPERPGCTPSLLEARSDDERPGAGNRRREARGELMEPRTFIVVQDATRFGSTGESRVVDVHRSWTGDVERDAKRVRSAISIGEDWCRPPGYAFPRGGYVPETSGDTRNLQVSIVKVYE